MKNGEHASPSKRGRKPKTDVDRFQAMTWYNSLASYIGADNSYSVKQFVFDKKEIGRRVDKETNTTWDEYKSGNKLPKDGPDINGLPGPVAAAADRYPLSRKIYYHPLWVAMRTRRMSREEFLEQMQELDPAVRKWYPDFEEPFDVTDFFVDMQWRTFHIPDGDYYAAFDHLAANLMFLRLGIWEYFVPMLKECALNIAATLGPLSKSPLAGPFHEELFDWLEANVWGDLFEKHYESDDSQFHGWRKLCSEGNSWGLEYR